MRTRAILKVKWFETDNGWKAKLVTVSDSKYHSFPLEVRNPVDLYVSDERRCTGFRGSDGRTVCPTFQSIDSGSQCEPCRSRDLHSDYVEGRGSNSVAGDFVVYLAQFGEETYKVGVTREKRVMERWVEQGAHYAGLVKDGLTQLEALSLETEISEETTLNERVRKENKEWVGSTPKQTLVDVGERIGHPISDVVNVQEKTIYPEFSKRKFVRSGRFSGEIQAVRGQVIQADDICMILTEGRVITSQKQKGLGEFF